MADGLHRIRERLVRERVALTNHLYGLLGEFEIVLPEPPVQSGAGPHKAQCLDRTAGYEVAIRPSTSENRRCNRGRVHIGGLHPPRGGH